MGAGAGAEVTLDLAMATSRTIGQERLMGKVYDALRRAEAQRSEAGDDPRARVPSVVSTLDRAKVRVQAPFWQRWLGRKRRLVLEDGTALNKRRISLLRPDSFVAEQFRTLRARIDSISAEHPIRSIAMTSAVAGEGKTVSAVNFALVNAMSVGRRVLLIDCDLRNPKVHAALGLQPEAGLAEVLLDRANLADAITKVEGVSLEVLPVRGQPANPSELLASDRMRALVEEVSQTYDRVVLDTPPVLALPDAKTVSDYCDAILLVVQAGSTATVDISATLEVLDRRRVLGVVLNGVEDASDHYGYPG
ncbi:MAG: CpsD/CapB family tyrosine-protein kinase [Myxococcota bacterium]